VRQIGEGGFGVVWLAEQERPVRREVALKIIKLGMDTKEVIARFEQERQALALMDHPNIAKVFDAGATQYGRPYFVMELVRGSKITDYCDAYRLTIKERLKLFVTVCQAVQHAHQKGIIHRDIKPSNILVTLHDGMPVPKVIDFGVAKATQQRLTELTLFTQLEQLIGTPLYMSPEQTAPGSQDIDTRSDIYALGVLLYELLTGRTPLDSESLMKASLEEIRRVIREEVPARPSTALNAMAAHVLVKVSQRRSCDPWRLIHIARGDLDWISMKSLEKDRTRRYATANDLALDVQRHLVFEPVLARPPSGLYCLSRFIRRSRVALTVTGSIVLALVASISLAVRTYYKPREVRSYFKARPNQAAQPEQTAAVELRIRRIQYAADMNRAQMALREHNLGRARQLLDQYREGRPDLRGWEWRYLWQQCRSDAIAKLFNDSRRHLSLSINRRFNSPIQEQSVLSLSYSADGKMLAVAYNDGATDSLELWDLPPRKHILAQESPVELRIVDSKRRTFEVPGRGMIGFAPRGYLLVQATNFGINLYDFSSTEAPTRVDLGGTVRAFSFTKDGTSLICRVDQAEPASSKTPKAQRIFKVVNLSTRQVVEQAAPSNIGFSKAVGDVRFSPDGTSIYVAGRSGRSLTVGVFDWLDAAPKKEFSIGADHRLYAIDVSPDGKTLVAASAWENSAQAWDTDSSKLITKLDQETGGISDLAFSPDGLMLAAACSDQTIRVWNTTIWKERALLRGHVSDVRAIAFSPDGKRIASGSSDGEVLIWNAETLSTGSERFDFPSDIAWAVPLPDTPLIWAQSTTGVQSLWDVSTLKQTPVPPELASTPNVRVIGRTVSTHAHALGGKLVALATGNNGVQVLGGETGGDLRLQGAPPVVDGLAFTHDGKRLVTTSSARETVKIWDPTNGQELLSLPGRGRNLYYADFTDNDNALIVASELPGFVQLWRAPSLAEIDAMERSAGPWPISAWKTSPPYTPPQFELKVLLERARRRIPFTIPVPAEPSSNLPR
jgi:serine/threonine protein kinase/WD40 repeat protein